MNKNTMIAIVAGVVVIAGVSVWFFVAPKSPTENSTNTTTAEITQNNSPAIDMTEAPVVEVKIQDFKYSPANITVKKGTTVIWTNEDNDGHNVVSNTGTIPGGPPAEAPLLGQHQQFSFTYDVVGTFDYHCTPHPFMAGTVTVVD